MAKHGVRMTEELVAKLEDPIAELGISVRTANTLNDEGIITIAELLDCCGCASVSTCPNSGKKHLLGISNFGEKTLEEVRTALAGSGFVREGKR